MSNRKSYPSDLSDREWQILEPLFPPEKTGGRHRAYEMREIIDVEPPPMPAFTVLPRRWVVERTIVRLGRYRRLSKDYEYLTDSSEAVICLAVSRLMLRRLSLNLPYRVPSRQRLGLKR